MFFKLKMLTFINFIIFFVYLCFQDISLYKSFHYLLLSQKKHYITNDTYKWSESYFQRTLHTSKELREEKLMEDPLRFPNLISFHLSSVFLHKPQHSLAPPFTSTLPPPATLFQECKKLYKKSWVERLQFMIFFHLMISLYYIIIYRHYYIF